MDINLQGIPYPYHTHTPYLVDIGLKSGIHGGLGLCPAGIKTLLGGGGLEDGVGSGSLLGGLASEECVVNLGDVYGAWCKVYGIRCMDYEMICMV